MQRIILAAALVATSIVTAKAETVYIGNAFIDVVSGPASCTSTFTVGDYFRGIYRPRGAALGNGADSHLALTGTRSNVVLRVANNDFQAGVNYATQSVGSTLAIGTTPGGAVTVWQQTGANGAATIKVVSRFSNFFRISGCFVQFRTNFIKR